MSKLVVELRFQNEKNHKRNLTLIFKDQEHVSSWISLKEYFGCRNFETRVIGEEYHKYLKNIKEAKEVKSVPNGTYEARPNYKRNPYSITHHRDNIQMHNNKTYSRKKTPKLNDKILELLKSNVDQKHRKFLLQMSSKDLISFKQKEYVLSLYSKNITVS